MTIKCLKGKEEKTSALATINERARNRRATTLLFLSLLFCTCVHSFCTCACVCEPTLFFSFSLSLMSTSHHPLSLPYGVLLFSVYSFQFNRREAAMLMLTYSAAPIIHSLSRTQQHYSAIILSLNCTLPPTLNRFPH